MWVNLHEWVVSSMVIWQCSKHAAGIVQQVTASPVVKDLSEPAFVVEGIQVHAICCPAGHISSILQPHNAVLAPRRHA